MSLFTRKHVAAVAAATIATFALGTSAASAADTTDVTVTGGSLSITNPAVGDFTAVTLNGAAQTTTASFAGFSVTDARGSGAGWNVTVQASRFTEVDSAGAAVTGAKQLPLSSLSMAATTVAADGTDSALPSITSGPYTIDAASAVKIASAATDAGMGKYDFTQATPPLTLSLPAATTKALADGNKYRSTVTVSVVSGP